MDVIRIPKPKMASVSLQGETPVLRLRCFL